MHLNLVSVGSVQHLILSSCLSKIFVKPLRRKGFFLGCFLTLKRHMILPGGEVFFVNYSTLVFGDSSLYLSKTFYLTGHSKYVLETPSLATMNSKRVNLRAVSCVFYALHWHSRMLSWRFRKVFHA